jgi:maltooligosyltrehalose trehalohydrolase
MLDWFKQMIHLRRSSTPLNDGELGHTRVRYDAQKSWLAMERGHVLVLANLGPEWVELEVPRQYRLVACSRPDVQPSGDKITLPADTFALLSGESA